MFSEKQAKIIAVSFRMATEADQHLPVYDNTKLQAYNTCNLWGTVRYALHKTIPTSGRSMALECGSAMHEMFAYVRLLTLIEQVRERLGEEAAVSCERFHAARLFGLDRWAIIRESEGDTREVSLRCVRGAISVLATSGYYDDPRDKKRTLSNMEEAAIAYIHKWRWNERIWQRDLDNPTSDVGIEIPFDLVVETTYALDPTQPTPRDEMVIFHGDGIAPTITKFRRFSGKIDGLHWNEDGEVVLDENKTASRLNDAWSASFQLNTQPTGYCIAASTFTGDIVRKAVIHGIAIPLPKTYDYGGIIREPVRREEYHIKSWIRWFNTTAQGIEEDLANPLDALKFTHSCNRYFRPCSLVPFCDASREEQERMLEQDLVVDEWSPLHGVNQEVET